MIENSNLYCIFVSFYEIKQHATFTRPNFSLAAANRCFQFSCILVQINAIKTQGRASLHIPKAAGAGAHIGDYSLSAKAELQGDLVITEFPGNKNTAKVTAYMMIKKRAIL